MRLRETKLLLADWMDVDVWMDLGVNPAALKKRKKLGKGQMPEQEQVQGEARSEAEGLNLKVPA